REAAVGEMDQTALAQMGEGELSDLAVVGQHSRKGPIGQGAGHVDHRQADRLESCCLLAGHYAGQDAVSPPTVQPARPRELSTTLLVVDGPAVVFAVIACHTLEQAATSAPRGLDEQGHVTQTLSLLRGHDHLTRFQSSLVKNLKEMSENSIYSRRTQC